MRQQEAKKRVKNFNEVEYGLTEQEAILEAKRCIQCANQPCVSGCPAEINIPAFIDEISKKNYKRAISIIKETNNLPAVCGRVCPQEDQCEVMCVFNKSHTAIDIGHLERFAADWERENREEKVKSKKLKVKKNKEKVAIIGAGPAGLTCAADLANKGYNVTIFEALHESGGVLTYGIPGFRLPHDILVDEINEIIGLGVELKLNYVIGKIKTIDDLRNDGFKSIFIGTGAGSPYFMGIEGENLNGVYSANEFLTRVNLMKAYKFPGYDTPIKTGKKVAVVGAGNVAMDSVRSALRLGNVKPYVIYRRTEDEMPARIDEIKHAKEEGVVFHLLTTPLKILGDKDGNVTGLLCLKNELGEPDDSGRRRPVPIEGSEFELEMDSVIIAIGNGPNPLLLRTIGELELNKKGTIKVDDKCRTNIRDIFAGGDIVTGAATVIEAMGLGKQAAKSIDLYLGEIRDRS